MSDESMQALVDSMSAQWQRERAKTQMTLGDMIVMLEALPQDTEIKGLGELNSYRGHYCDLAFEPSAESETAASLLTRCTGAIGKVFYGYKGGEYMMGSLTPLWLANYGCCGDKIVAITLVGTIQTRPDAE